jgi:hypothetical protein
MVPRQMTTHNDNAEVGVLLALALVASLWNADTLSAAEVRDSYPEFLELSVDSMRGEWYVSVHVDTLLPGHPLAGYVRERQRYLSYVASHVTERLERVNLASPSVRDSLRRAFYTQLRGDSIYDRAILGPLAGYLADRGGALTGYRPARVDGVPMSRAVAVAARFYNPDVLLPDGRIGVHICVAKNGLFRTLGERDLALEALAFAAVWEDMSRPDSLSFAGKDFDSAFARVKALPRTGSPSERVERAQQTMWNALESGTGLRVLLGSITGRWGSLPFALRPD